MVLTFSRQLLDVPSRWRKRGGAGVTSITWKGNATEAEDFGREGAYTYTLQSRVVSSWQEAEITSILFLSLWK